MKKSFSNKIKLLVLALVISVGGFFAYNNYASDTFAADCSNDAVIKCGVQTISELRTKYANDFTKGTKNIFEWFGINSTIVNTYKAEAGTIHRNGNVYIGNKLVATGAITAGRQQIHDVSVKRVHKGTTFYTHSLSVFRPASVKAFVFTDKNGKFVGAVMLDCGNPVKAKPVEPPKPAPKYACSSLSRIKQSDPNKYIFRGKASVENGAKATGFTFDFGNGKTQYVKVQRTEGKFAYADAPYTYTKPGTYNVKVTAHFTVGGKSVTETSTNCQKPVTIPKKEVPPAPEPKYIEVCRLSDKKFPVRIKEEDFDKKLHSMDPKDCKEKPVPPAPKYIEVCRLADKQFPVRIKESDFDKRLHSLDPEDCAEVVVPEEPKMIEVCRLEDKVFPVTIKESDFDDKLHSLSPEDCDDEAPAPEPKPEPVVVEEAVTELPKTGLADSLSGLLGLGTLTTAAYYYATSRRNG